MAPDYWKSCFNSRFKRADSSCSFGICGEFIQNRWGSNRERMWRKCPMGLFSSYSLPNSRKETFHILIPL